jgi:hypothetical protein
VAPALLLFILAPLNAELLSGSTPPLLYFNPLTILFMHASYGAAAVLLREWALRRGIGSWGRVLLAAAMGLYIEGMLCKSLYSPHWADFNFPEGWGRLWGVNWPWTACLLLYHAVNSFLLPWLIVDLLWPQFAKRPALRPSGMALLGVLVLTAGLLGWFGFEQLPGRGVYYPGWLALAVSWLGPLGIAALATLIPDPAGSGRFRPRGWLLGWLSGLGWLGYFLTQGLGDGGRTPALQAFLAVLGFAVLLLVLAWLWRGRLDDWRRYCLVLGNTCCWAVLGVMQECKVLPNSDATTGMTFVALGCLAGVAWLGGFIWRRERAMASTAPTELSTAGG